MPKCYHCQKPVELRESFRLIRPTSTKAQVFCTQECLFAFFAKDLVRAILHVAGSEISVLMQKVELERVNRELEERQHEQTTTPTTDQNQTEPSDPTERRDLQPNEA